jgi:FtsZ-binding cell division protein ZapB
MDEQNYANEYHQLEAKIKEARDNGDTYEMSELKDKREIAQSKYWEARKKREGIISEMEKQQEAVYEKQWVEALDTFNNTIQEYVPEFNEDVAAEIREFALSEGVAEEFIDQIVDPVIVKFVNDYRILKQGVKKGEAKRKTAPTKKIPVKKAQSTSKKKADQDAMIKARAFKEDADPNDQMAFLRQIASRSLGE